MPLFQMTKIPKLCYFLNILCHVASMCKKKNWMRQKTFKKLTIHSGDPSFVTMQIRGLQPEHQHIYLRKLRILHEILHKLMKSQNKDKKHIRNLVHWNA